jgi:BTB/POZ domain
MSQIVKLNVGGIKFTTTHDTLCINSPWFSRMLGATMKPGLVLEERIFIDRSGELFRHVLDYLRNREHWTPPSDLKLRADLRSEATYFGLSEMESLIQPERALLLVNDRNVPSYFENVPTELEGLISKYPDDARLDEVLRELIPYYTLVETTQITDIMSVQKYIPRNDQRVPQINWTIQITKRVAEGNQMRKQEKDRIEQRMQQAANNMRAHIYGQPPIRYVTTDDV